MAEMKNREHVDIADVHDIFDHLHELDNHWDRVVLMCEHLPDWSPRKVEGLMPKFLSMSAHNLERVLMHSDPTGERAVRNVMAVAR